MLAELMDLFYRPCSGLEVDKMLSDALLDPR